MRGTSGSASTWKTELACRIVEHPVGGVDREGLRLAQVDQADDVVDVAVGQHRGLDGAVAQAALRVGVELRRLR